MRCVAIFYIFNLLAVDKKPENINKKPVLIAGNDTDSKKWMFTNKDHVITKVTNLIQSFTKQKMEV